MTVYVGIDPGFTGAIAFYWPKPNRVEVHDMPVYKNIKGKTELNLYELHCSAQATNDISHAVQVETILRFKQRQGTEPITCQPKMARAG